MLNPAEPYLSTHSAAAPSDPQKAVQASLGLARHYVAHGNTTAALQVVFDALRTACGEAAAQTAAARVESHLLHMHLQPQQASTQCAADQLADILTSCSLDNQQPQQSMHHHSSRHADGLDTHMQQLDLQGSPGRHRQDLPLLMELRGMNLAEVGISDDSNFICQRCGGIVSKSRQTAHQQFWCQSR